MKILRRLLIGFGIAVLLLALFVGAALLPSIQRWLVLKALAGRPELHVSLERVAVRPGSVAIEGLRVEQPGAGVTLADARIEMSLWEILANRRVHIRNATVAGLKIDLARSAPAAPVPGAPTPASAPKAAPSAPAIPGPAQPSAHPGPAPEPAAPTSYEGVFKRLQFDREIVLDACSIDAEVAFHRAAGQPPGNVRFKVRGGGFAPGREARFDFEAQAADPAPEGPVSMVEARGALTLALNARREFERVALHGAAEARGPALPTPVRLQADVILARTAAGEKYALALSSSENGKEQRLFGVDCDFVAGTPRLNGAWDVHAGDRQLAPFLLGLGLPQFTAVGAGRFEINPSIMAGRLSGRLAWNSNRLEVLDPRLRNIGALQADTAFDFEYEEGQVRVTELTADVRGAKPLVSLRSVQPYAVNPVTLEIAAADPRKELLRVKLDGVPVAWLQPFLPDFEVSGDELKGEFVVALRGDTMWLHTTSPVRISRLAVAKAGRTLLPDSELSIEAEVGGTMSEMRAQLDGFTLKTAAGDRIEGRGGVTIKLGATPSVSVQAGYEARLPALLAQVLPGFGALETRGEVVLAQTSESIQIGRLAAQVFADGDRPLVEISSRQPFRIDTVGGQAAITADKPGEVLRMNLARLPLSLLQPWLGELQLQGELAQAEFSMRAEGRNLHVAGTGSVRVEKLSAAAGQPLLQNLTIEIEPSVDWSARGMTAKLLRLRVLTEAGAALLTGQAEATLAPDFSQPAAQGTVTFEASMVALASQPLLGGRVLPGQGRLSGETKFAYNSDLRTEGRFTLNGLVSTATGKPLPVANLSFRAGLGSDGTLAVQAPLLIDRSGERSDLTLAGTLRPDGKSQRIDARVTGEHFVADDAIELARVFTVPAKPPAPPRARGAIQDSPQRDSRPPSSPPANAAGRPPTPLPTAPPKPAAASEAAWAGLTGQVTLDIKSLVYGDGFEVRGLAGKATIDQQRIAVEKLTGRLGDEGLVALDAEARFAAGAAQPYASRLDFTLQEFEIGPLFKALSPDKPPTFEGRFNVRSQATGAGRDLADLIKHTRGDFTLQSRKGVSRLLQQQATQLSRTARIVGGVTSILGGLGVVDPNKAENIALGADVAAELGGLLAELPYDQLNVRLSRDESLNLKLSDFTLVSPVARLQGDGLVSYEPGRSLFDQALQVRLNMGVMGAAETALAKAKSPLLSGERDELGYMKLREGFVIGGTLGKPDPAQLYALLSRSVLDRLLR